MQNLHFLNINVNDEIHRKLRLAAAHAGVPIRVYVRVAIAEKIQRDIEALKLQKRSGNSLGDQSGDLL